MDDGWNERAGINGESENAKLGEMLMITINYQFYGFSFSLARVSLNL